MQITKSVQVLDGEDEGEQEPAEQQAIGMMMRDVFQTVAVLGIIKGMILDLPPGFGQAIQAFRTDMARFRRDQNHS
jgi:hypothetical protein